ncbi:hypothetical protein SAMN05216466_106121 [Paraburkholderia phenazinium]|uniref:Uncharacterized protein n=1 Tax=Paraburkholderia phenazinium TaxID=60549 RepID=A0A1G7YC09_9BURK|nr:hypothetical protein [Paraburkholderia phenazinium]SDG93905.1 hypothetical protein SAMN05216466_106121 [Paraburkholderia phenazinium]
MRAHPARFFHAFLFGGLAVSVLAIAGLVASAAMAERAPGHVVRPAMHVGAVALDK